MELTVKYFIDDSDMTIVAERYFLDGEEIGESECDDILDVCLENECSDEEDFEDDEECCECCGCPLEDEDEDEFIDVYLIVE